MFSISGMLRVLGESSAGVTGFNPPSHRARQRSCGEFICGSGMESHGRLLNLVAASHEAVIWITRSRALSNGGFSLGNAGGGRR